MIATEAVAGVSFSGANKIQAAHRDRLAVVYVRQSSPQQVLAHRESTALQYVLQRRAIEWGWAPERVRVTCRICREPTMIWNISSAPTGITNDGPQAERLLRRRWSCADPSG